MVTCDSLLDMLDEGMGDDSEGPLLFQSSPYYDHSAFNEVLKNKSNMFSVISFNCRSLNARFDDIHVFLQEMHTSSQFIDAFCVQETWLEEGADVSLLNIDGYNLICKGKSSSRCGGTAIYLKDNYNYNRLSYSSESNIWDGLFLEIEDRRSSPTCISKNIIIGNIYRPPRNNVDNLSVFTNELNELMMKLQRQRHEAVIVGDFNLNLLNIKTDCHIKDYLDMALGCGFLPKITFPTRLCSGTLIDNIYVKISEHYSETTAGILWHQWSDHQPCFVILDFLFKKVENHKYVEIKNNDTTAINNVKEELSKKCSLENFKLELVTDPNTNYNNLIDTITTTIEKHMPIRLVKFRKHKHKKPKWITKGILISIRYRDRLYSQLQMTDRNDVNYLVKKQNLSTYNRILKQNIRLAKKQYYHQRLSKFKDDIKKTWSCINEIISKSKKKHDFPKQFLINNNFVAEPRQISDEFNKFFVDVGKNISDSISQPQNRTYEEFLNNPYPQNF